MIVLLVECEAGDRWSKTQHDEYMRELICLNPDIKVPQ